MPVFAADVLPDTTGRNLGSPPQRWNFFAQNVDIFGNLRYQAASGAVIAPTGVIYALTSEVTAAANSTGWQALASCQIPAGLLNAQGKILRATLAGNYLTQSGQNPQLSVQVGFGLTQLFSIQTDSFAAGTFGGWRAQIEVTVYVPGSVAQIMPSGAMTVHTNTAVTDVGEVILFAPTLLSGVDLTVADGLSCHCLFSMNTSPANICNQTQFIVEVLN